MKKENLQNQQSRTQSDLNPDSDLNPESELDSLKNEALFIKQKALLDTFLEHGAITSTQYNKSLGDLSKKMGMEK